MKAGWYAFGADGLTPVGPFDSFYEAQKADGKACTREQIALDKSSTSARTYDSDGRMSVDFTPISKANICEYKGSEIPDPDGKLNLDPEKKYKLYRDPDELAKAAKSFNNIQLLIKHIPVDANDHRPDEIVGTTGSDAKFEAPYLKNSLKVWSRRGLDAIESNTQKELSSAYRYRADMTPGTHEGEAYDGVMRDIEGNHVALVTEGRAGSDVVVQDSALPHDDDNPKEILVMPASKIVLSRRAAVAKGALMVFLKPKLAQDAKIDFDTLLKDVSSKNFSAKKSGIVTALKTATRGKLAQDANLDDVTSLLDALEKNEEVEGADADPDTGLPMERMDRGTNDAEPDPLDKGREFLKGKLNAEDMEAFDAMCPPKEAAGDKKKAADAGMTAEEKAKAEKETADKKAKDEEDKDKEEKAKEEKAKSEKAMDAAITNIRQTVLAEQKALREAEKAVRPYVGEIIAQDSAEATYRVALESLGVKDAKTIHASALPSLLSAQPTLAERNRSSRSTANGAHIAQDGSALQGFNERYPEAGRIGSSDVAA